MIVMFFPSSTKVKVKEKMLIFFIISENKGERKNVDLFHHQKQTEEQVVFLLSKINKTTSGSLILNLQLEEDEI